MSLTAQRIAITGANGFIGRAVIAGGLAAGFDMLALTRVAYASPLGVRNIAVGNLNSQTEWTDALAGVDTLIHLAAYQPSRSNFVADADLCRQVNVKASEHLARQAAAAGVRRLIFMSSAKVHGELSLNTRPFTEAHVPTPQDIYGISKWEAEQGLWAIARATNMELVVIRPPLVYGPSVGGNMQSLIRLSRSGIPLPLKHVKNRRSMIGIDNLVDFILLCCNHPYAAGETFLISDGEDIATPDLLSRLGAATDTAVHLFPVSVGLLELVATTFGQRTIFNKLCGSFQVDTNKAHQKLNWHAPHNLDYGLLQMIRSASE